MDDQAPSTPPIPTNNPESQADPGRTMAIVGLVCAFIFALLGLILCIIARNKSQSVGHNNTIATVGIIVAILNMLAGIGLRLGGVI